MRLGVWPQPHPPPGDPVGEAFQIALECVEIDDQCRCVDLVEDHADLGRRAGGHVRLRARKRQRRSMSLRARRGNLTPTIWIAVPAQAGTHWSAPRKWESGF